jgi:hypothetical protein
MPTIVRTGSLRIVIYLNDHPPPHVHVIGDGQAIFSLNCPDGPPLLEENFGLPNQRLSHATTEIAANLATLCSEWKRIHGDNQRAI